MTCPNCGSRKVHDDGIYGWYCDDCDQDWEEDE